MVNLDYEDTKRPFIRNSEFCLDRQLVDKSEKHVAEGGFARVYEVKWRGAPIAVKIVRTSDSRQGIKRQQQLQGSDGSLSR